MRCKTHILLVLLVMGLSLAACQSVNQEYLKNFEVVWQTVNDTFPDPTFGGVDWKAVHDRYQPLIGAAKNDEEFFLTLNRMLWELNASHAVVMPNKLMFNLDRAFAEGGIGIDVRLIDDEVVITRVKPSSPADQAGLVENILDAHGFPKLTRGRGDCKFSLHLPVFLGFLPASCCTNPIVVLLWPRDCGPAPCGAALECHVQE